MAKVQPPSVGRIVRYRSLPVGPAQAAVIVKVWSATTVNLAVFRDGSNDEAVDHVQGSGVTYWATSAHLAPGLPEGSSHAWDWPEFVPAIEVPDEPKEATAP